MIKLSEVMKRSTFIKHNEKIILKLDVSDLQEDEDVQRVADYFISIAKKMPSNSINGLANFSRLNVTSKIETDIFRLASQANHCFKAFAVVVSEPATMELAGKMISSKRFQGNNIKVFEAVDNAKNWISNVG